MERIRCAIYTRKSSEEGLEQEFNSLHAQREACAAYVSSQKAEGWVLLPQAYDDGGISGGTMDRPGLNRLLADIDAGLVDRIVVYKIDRLTRSLADFARIVDRLDAAGTSFVSVTQSFNTATSMGRLTLNMLLSFAQFEREVTAERIRDKIAASKRKGLWMGGNVPLGYDAAGRTLTINEAEATTVRTLYDLYRQHGIVRRVTEEADALGLRTKTRTKADGSQSGGQPFQRGHVHHLLSNPIYAGRIRHRKEIHEGQHPAIIPPQIWDQVQDDLKAEAMKPRGPRASGTATKSRLAGRIFDETGDRLTPSHTRTRTGQRLRYYVSHRLIARSGEAGVAGWRLPGPELEAMAAQATATHLTAPGIAAQLIGDAETDTARLQLLHGRISQLAASPGEGPLLALIARVDLAPGLLSIQLDAKAVSEAMELDRSIPDDAPLSFKTPFRSRKRGVETKLLLGNAALPVDQRLLTNIARAHQWFAMLREGRSFQQIADAAGTSKRRVQHMIGLAFLAPDIVKSITEGRQPVGLTSDWLKRHDLPSDWNEQRRLIATLR